MFMPKLNKSILQSLIPKQAELIVSPRSFECGLCGLGRKDHLSELFPPADLVSAELVNLPSVLAKLQNFLDARGALLQQHFLRRIHLPSHMASDPEFLAVPIKHSNRTLLAGRQISLELSSVRSAQSNDGDTQNAVREIQSEECTARTIAMRLKYDKKKFGCSLGEYQVENVDGCKQIAEDHKLIEALRLSIFTIVFEKVCKGFISIE